MSYIPPHLRRPKTAAADAPVNTSRRVKFIGDALGGPNVADTTVRHSPHRNRAPTRRTIRHVRKITPNAAPPQKPSHALRHAAPKFAEAARKHIGIQEWGVHTKKRGKRHGKKHQKK